MFVEKQTLRHKLLPAAYAMAILFGIVAAMNCSGDENSRSVGANGANRSSSDSVDRVLQENRPSRSKSASPNGFGEFTKRSTVSELLSVWDEYTDDQLWRIVVQIVSSDEDDRDARLRIFILSEEEFLALDEREYHEQQRDHLKRGQELLRLSHNLAQIAQARDADGHADEADAICEAVYAIGKANSDAALSRLARSFGNAVITVFEDTCQK